MATEPYDQTNGFGGWEGHRSGREMAGSWNTSLPELNRRKLAMLRKAAAAREGTGSAMSLVH